MELDSNSAERTKQTEQKPLSVGAIASENKPKKAFKFLPAIVFKDQEGTPPSDHSSEPNQSKEGGPLKIWVVKDDDLSAFEKKTVVFGKVGLVVAICSFIAASIAAYVVWGQLKEAAAQTDLLGIQARQARSDSNYSSIATAKQFSTLQSQVAEAHKATGVLRFQLGAEQKAVQVDQRAWLFASDPIAVIEKTKPIGGNAKVTNTGKTPAIHMTAKLEVTLSLKDSGFGVSYVKFGTNQAFSSPITLFPSQHTPIATSHTKTFPFQDQWIDRVKVGELVAFEIGIVRYRDIFGNPHWTHFCYRYNPDLTSGNMCKVYNDTDDDRRNHPN